MDWCMHEGEADWLGGCALLMHDAFLSLNSHTTHTHTHIHTHLLLRQIRVTRAHILILEVLPAAIDIESVCRLH